jgi:glucosylceramidase
MVGRIEDGRMALAAPRWAVAFKTCAWDGFVERHARRLAEAAPGCDPANRPAVELKPCAAREILNSQIMTHNRRDFLRRAASSSMLALWPRWMRAERAHIRTATLYVTDAREKHAARAALQWVKATGGAPGATIEVDSTRQFQAILGFGAALTDASCFLLSGMPAAGRRSFLREIYSPAGLNLNMGRCCIGASDYSRNVYSYDDVPDDMNLDYFSLKHDEAYILPTLREIREINPNLFLMAAPWSPPGWMKTYGTTFGGRTTENFVGPYTHALWELANGSMRGRGGWMSENYLSVYAQYLEKFLHGYAQAGVPVHALAPQNEPLTTQAGRMPACRWSPELEAEFIRDHLGPLLRKQHQDTQIWLLDHDYSYYQRVATQLQDKQLAQYVSGVAWHGYTGTPDQMSLVHRDSVPFYWTEGGPFLDDPDYLTGWAKWAATFTDVLQNWCRCAITWNLMLDARGKPNIGPFNCAGLVTLQDDGNITRSAQYHALRHFSLHLQRDGRRIASEADASGLRHVAVENPDGSFALVMTNPGEAKALRIVCAGQQLSISLPRDSIATVAW